MLYNTAYDETWGIICVMEGGGGSLNLRLNPPDPPPPYMFPTLGLLMIWNEMD